MEKTIANFDFIKKVGCNTNDGIAIYDIESKKFVYNNNNFAKIFEIENNTILDYNVLLKFIPAEDVDFLKLRYNKLKEFGSINTTEFRINLIGNKIKHLSCDILVLEDANLITVFVKDVSKVKEHEDFLIKTTAQKDTLLDTLTHNLSGPLQLSNDMINSLKQGYNNNDTDDINKLLKLMQENTQHCIDIVNDFLRQEHIESIHTYVKKTRFNIIEKVNVTIDKLKAMNKDKAFTLSCDSEVLNISSDAVKFFQIIHNILSNSIKFTDPNGSIKIVIKELPKHYLFSFKDDGIGIPDEEKEFIFVKKIKGRVGLKGEKSSGLGLHIAHKLVMLLNGKIWFESTEKKGTIFYLELPKE